MDDFELWLPEEEVVVLGPVTPNPLMVPMTDASDAPHGLLRPVQPEMEAITADLSTLDEPIVFQKDREDGRSSDIYILDAGSDIPRQLTSTLAHDTHPALSPDGSTVAFSSWENGYSNIYLMDVETLLPNPLTAAGSPGYECYNDQPAWSPDGTQLVFVSRDKGSASSLRIIEADGTPVRSLLDNDAYSEWAPTWSPDGTQLALVANRALGIFGFPGTVIISATDVYGNPSQIGEMFEIYPAWSPDGTRIAVNSPLGVMATYAADGTDRQPLGEIGWHPTWSPDGQSIAYHTVDLYANPIQFMIAVMAASGGDGVSIDGTEGGYFPSTSQLWPGPRNVHPAARELHDHALELGLPLPFETLPV